MRDESDKIDMSKLAEEIAGYLGEEWQAAPGYHGHREDARIAGPDGEELHLSQNTWRQSDKGKVFVSGTIPRDLSEHAPRNADTGDFAATVRKGAAKLANDVRTRCLPEYRATLAAAREDKAKSDAAHEAAVTLRAEITAALGEHARRSHREHHVGIGKEFGRGLYGEAEVRPFGDDVSVEIRVPRTLVVAVMRAVAGVLNDHR